ncbi:zinc-ribbon domain-containing protein [Candidatus Micrarchaeota archaeon]|jgi:ribosomal protein L37E|nr:zinc-ribbon domain-containing protein [Candidatus Micrarchaeota archaeon]
MKRQHVIGGLLIFILGIIIYLSTTSGGIFDAYEICHTLKIFEPCSETVGWLSIISIILILFGVIDFIYGVVSSYNIIERHNRVEKTNFIKEVEEKIYIRCPKCGVKNEENVKYCKECGVPLHKKEETIYHR